MADRSDLTCLEALWAEDPTCVFCGESVASLADARAVEYMARIAKPGGGCEDVVTGEVVAHRRCFDERRRQQPHMPLSSVPPAR